MQLIQIVQQVAPLPDASLEKIMEQVRETAFAKNHLLMRAGKIERNLYFIKTGIVRAYAHTEEHEITFWFGSEGETIVSMNSYVAGKAGYENIELLEPCILYELKTEALQRLYQEDLHIANWGRKFAEKELIKTEERLISRQFRTAAQRYKELLEENAYLLQRVPLCHIASYLGITQVSLSRIRSDIR
ncbi:Crp/Fnr family transcriptional regulator [Niabella beijingensis]|uniref:Crp/Fnr family transcriptional regulator n=1 Tax=Niabella beijingensis TaxID=2872700 RepID=UPI001CBC54CB|nr:Crp/Fnr family transcriptional regulator [Niabella beijingensis]MBZ4187544.1 Crp/Fnr family transcriptional regulator [Niabella beijingensis]